MVPDLQRLNDAYDFQFVFVGHAFEREDLCYNGLANKPFEFRNGFDIVGQWKVSMASGINIYSQLLISTIRHNC